MSLWRVWVYTLTCDQAGCYALIEVRVSFGAEQAREAGRAHGWQIYTRGKRRGWRTYCPEHHQPEENLP